MNPEELENTELVQETEVEQEQLAPEKPRRVEVDPDELRELREQNRRFQEELHQHKLWQMQQIQQRNTPPDPQVDPDVERVIAPVVQKALRPVLDENERLKGHVTQLAEQARVQANIDFIERNIPNFDAIRVDLAKKIESLPKADQDMVLNSPTLMVELAKTINSDRGNVVRQTSRSRAVSESSTATSASQHASSFGNVDWNSLSPAEFAAMEAKIEQQRRGRNF